MRVVFMGTPEFALPALKTLIRDATVVAVYTQPDKPVGRGLQMQASPVKRLALEHGIPVFTPEKISTSEEVERLQSFGADFFVIVAYGQILKLSVIQLPRYGTINIHSSLLPRWRGAAPIHWALLSGDEETGVTTMMIVPKLDAGDILLQEKTKITSDDTSSSLHDRLAEMGGRLILPTLEGVMKGAIQPIVQDESKVTYAKKLTKEMELLDWNESSSEIDLKVRALNPWPGTKIEIALSTGAKMKLKIKKGKPLFASSGREGSSKIGQLGSVGSDLILKCGHGSYQILELQEEGKKSVASADFLNGLKSRGIVLPLNVDPVSKTKEMS